ncbi:MAG: 6-bladed beta-propeller, partial [bacterium]
MNKYCNVLCLILFILYPGCKNQKYKPEITTPGINIEDAFIQNRFIRLSEFVYDNIEYVPLETGENIIDGSPRIYTLNNQILVFAFRQIFLFNRGNGNFIREIGKFDRGPGGYMATRFTFPFDPIRNTCFAIGWDRSYIEYSLEGDILRKIIRPEGSTAIATMNDSTYVAYIRNFSGNEERRLVVFDNEDIIKTFPNYKIVEPLTVFTGGDNGWFYRFREELCFFEAFNDTIYCVTENDLIPRYVLQMGKYAPPYEKQNVLDFSELQKYFRVKKIFESQNHLLFEVYHDNSSFQGVYNKETMITYIAGDSNGFDNDIDEFFPLRFTSVSSQGELIGFIEAWKVEQWFRENPDKSAKLPPHLKKLENITENDNPIVMI